MNSLVQGLASAGLLMLALQPGFVFGQTVSTNVKVPPVPSGGVAPADGCGASAYGKTALVPYTTDYCFYRASGRK